MNDQTTILAWYIFVEDPRTKLFRNAINEFQVHLILLEQDPDSLPLEEIYTKINSYPGCFPVTKEVTEEAINNSLKRTPPLIIKSDIGYRLSEERKIILEKAKASFKESEKKFEEYVILCIEKEYAGELKEEAKQKISEIIEPILVEFFNKRVLELDRVRSIPKYTIDASFERTQLEEWEEIINTYLTNIDFDETIKTVIKIGIENALFEIPTDGKRYIAAVHNKVFCTKFAMPDPSIIQMEKRMLAKRRLYLDTNVIIKAVFENSREHKICEELLNLRNDFNLQLFFSDFTKEELQRQREKAKKITHLLEQKKSLQLIHSIADTDIVRTYLKRKLSNPSLTIDSFLSIYDPWEEYLFEKYGILYENEFCEQTKKIDVSDRDLVYKYIKEAKIKRYKKYREPKTEAVEHDVNEFLLGHILRENYASDELGSKVWIITTDKAVTTKGQNYLKFKYPKPIFKLVEEWLERLLYINMVDIEGISIEKYIDLIVNTELGAIYEDPSLDIDFTVTLLDSNLPIDELRDLPPEHASRAILRLQEDKEVELLMERSKKVTIQELPEVHALFREKLLKAVHDEEESIRKVDAINIELRQLRETVQSLEKTINDLTSEIEKKDGLLREKDEDIISIKRNLLDLEKTKKYLKYGFFALGLILLLLIIFILRH
jgi:predicted nucleic acid-binding protein